MMNDCQNIEIREALPELVHGALGEIERTHVQEHLDDCDDCSAELAIIRAVRHGVGVAPVDIARIVAAIPPYRRQASRIKRVYLELAAACLIGVIGISTVVVHQSNSAARVTQSATAATTGAAAASSGIALVNTSDMSDAGLAQLTRDLGKLQAMPTVDPESVTPAALEAATEPGTSGASL